MVFATFFYIFLLLLFVLFFISVPPIAIDPNEVKDAASTRVDIPDKRNRQKRAAKSDATPPNAKKIKVSQEHVLVYDKFVGHGKKLKRQKQNDAKFVLIFLFFSTAYCFVVYTLCFKSFFFIVLFPFLLFVCVANAL
jgi:hypothetical protein